MSSLCVGILGGGTSWSANYNGGEIRRPCNTVIDFCGQFCRLSFGMGFGAEGGGSDEVPDLFLCPVLSFHLSFQAGNFPLVSNPIFSKLGVSAVAAASASSRLKHAVQLKFHICEEKNHLFLSLSCSFTCSIHH